MEADLTMQPKNFKGFIHFLRDKRQYREIYILAFLLIAVGIILHSLFPYPFTFSDSGAYLLGASKDHFNIFRPMGYSHYLKFIHGLNPSIHFVFFFTYFLHAVSVLFFLYTLKYLWNITYRPLFYGLCILAIATPRFWFAANFIMSDSLFSSLTLLFVTTSLWLIYVRKWWLIVSLLALFFGLYKVRYSGMFYLFIPMYALFLAFHQAKPLKKTLIVLIPAICFLFLYRQTKNEYHRQTGVNVSSGFSGWQLINNASVLFPEAKSIPQSHFGTPQLKALHHFMQFVPDSVFNDQHTFSTSYMWNKELPYKQFLFSYMQYTNQNYALTWVACGQLFGQYAQILIKEKPGKFFTNYILPSFASTFKTWDINEYKAPFINDPAIADYYHLNFDKYEHTHPLFSTLNAPRKVINYFYWLFLGVAICYFLVNIQKNKFSNKGWLIASLLLLFILMHIGASVLASPNTTWRYTMPVFLPSLAFIFYNLNDFIQNSKIRSKLLFKHKK